jgi:ABC-type lipoprotein release transport system permease subunit
MDNMKLFILLGAILSVIFTILSTIIAILCMAVIGFLIIAPYILVAFFVFLMIFMLGVL